MFTILGADGKQYGPVPIHKVQEWMRDGRANQQTKVQRVGETEWRTLGDFPEFADPATPPPLVPPVAPAPAPAPAAAPSSLPAAAGQIDVFECLSQSFHLWKDHFLPLVGVTLLIVVIQSAIGFIPLLGALSGLFLNGVFYGGLYYYYLGKIRGEPRELSDAFAGFNRAFVPLMLTTLLQSACIIACFLAFFAPWLGFFAQAVLHPGATPPALPHLTAGLAALSFVGGLLMLYLSVCWMFSFVLVIDKGLGPWAAIATSWRTVTRQWFRVFFVLLLGAILTMLGLLAVLVGILFTLPLVIGAVLYAYETLFNPPDSAPRNP